MTGKQLLLRSANSLVALCIVLLAPIGFAQSSGRSPQSTKPSSAAKAARPKTPTPKAKSSPESGPTALLQRHFDSAQKAEDSGNLVVAESEYRQALGLALGLMAETYQTLGDLDPAEAAFEESSQASVDSENALLGLGVVCLRKGEFKKGVEAVRKLLAQHPEHAVARQLLGKIYFSMSNYEAAANELQTAIQLDPDDSESELTLAFTYLKLQQPEKANKLFQKLVEQHGDSPQIHITFGAAYRETEYAQEAVDEFKRAAALNPKYPHLHYYLALAYLSSEGVQAFPLALEELAHEIRRDPNDYASQYMSGLVHQQNRELAEAIPFFAKAASIDPANPDAPLYLGESLYFLDRKEEAVEWLEKSIQLTADPSRNLYQISKAHYLLGQYYARLDRQEESKRHLALAQSYRAKVSVDDQQRLRIYLSSGMGSQDQLKDFASDMEGKAIIIGAPAPEGPVKEKLVAAASEYRKLSATAYSHLALLEARESNFPRATQFFELAAKWQPDLPDLQFNIGLANFKTQEFKRAAPHLDRALAQQPGRQDIRILAGLSHFFSSDYERAAEILARLDSLSLEDPQVAYARGLSLVYLHQRDVGTEILQNLVDRYPQSADAHLAMGQALAAGEEFGRAAAEFQRALALDPSVPQIHYYMGLALLRQDQFAAAAQEFQKEIAANPRDAKSEFHLGVTLAAQNQMDDAIAHYNSAVSLDPTYAEAFYELGKELLKKGLVQGAVANLEKSVQLEPNKSYVHYQLSQAYLKAGNEPAGQAALARYKELKSKERSPEARP